MPLQQEDCGRQHSPACHFARKFDDTVIKKLLLLHSFASELFHVVSNGSVAPLFWGDSSPPFEDLCAILGSYWFERCAYSLCKSDVSSSVLAPVSPMS